MTQSEQLYKAQPTDQQVFFQLGSPKHREADTESAPSLLPPFAFSFLLLSPPSSLLLLFPAVQGFTYVPAFLYYRKKGEEECRKKASPKLYPNVQFGTFSPGSPARWSLLQLF